MPLVGSFPHCEGCRLYKGKVWIGNRQAGRHGFKDDPYANVAMAFTVRLHFCTGQSNTVATNNTHINVWLGSPVLPFQLISFCLVPTCAVAIQYLALLGQHLPSLISLLLLMLSSFFLLPKACQDVAVEIRGRIEEFRPYIPLIQGLRNPGMRNRHWEMLSKEIKISIKPKANLTFARCLEMKLLDHIESIAKIAEIAGKEYAIENVRRALMTLSFLCQSLYPKVLFR